MTEQKEKDSAPRPKKAGMRIGIIGAGGRGIGAFGKALRDVADARVQALCDTNPVRLREGAAAVGGEPGQYTSAREMFDAEDLDAVIITTPDYLHADHACEALERGVHVLVDKPLATTVAGCSRIIRAAEQAERTVMIGFNLRHNPVLRRLKDVVDAGLIGRVFLIENREFYDGGRTYMSRWNRRREWSGGLWVHKGSHDFDVFQWLLNFPRPLRVSATAGINALDAAHIPFEVKPDTPVGPTCSVCAYRERCPDRAWYGENASFGPEAQAADGYAKDLCVYASDKDVHDNGIAIVEYDDGSRASHLECFVSSFTDRMYTLVGERGTAEVSLHDRRIVVRPRWKRGETMTIDIPPVEGGHGGADPGLLEAFLEVVRGGAANTSTTEHGLWSTAVGEAAEIAWREGRTVAIDELMSTTTEEEAE